MNHVGSSESLYLLTRALWLDYAIREKPQLVEDMQGGPDYIVLKSLDTDGIRLIGSVLGQSIALDYFVSQVGMCQMPYYLDLNFCSQHIGDCWVERIIQIFNADFDFLKKLKYQALNLDFRSNGG